MRGYIKLHRELENHWLWLNPKHLRAWLLLLFEASWEAKTIPWGKQESITIQRGQLVTTIRKLMGQWGYYAQATLDFLRVLEAQGMITRQSTSKMTIITIVNYDRYQLWDEYGEPDSKQKSKHNKIKEENNKIDYTPSREGDLKFYEDLILEKDFFDELSLKSKFDLEKVKWQLEEFKKEMLLQEKYHNSRQDYKSHFYNWFKKKFKLEDKTVAKNGEASKIEDKYKTRRGTDAGSHLPEDYGGAF